MTNTEKENEAIDVLSADSQTLESLLNEINETGIDCLDTLLGAIHNLVNQLNEGDREDGDPCLLAFEEDDALETIRGLIYLIYVNNTSQQMFDMVAIEALGMPPEDLHQIVLQRFELGVGLMALIKQYAEGQVEHSSTIFTQPDSNVVN